MTTSSTTKQNACVFGAIKTNTSPNEINLPSKGLKRIGSHMPGKDGQNEWPVIVYRRTMARGWERYIPVSRQHQDARQESNESRSGRSSMDEGALITETASPKRDCIELRQLRVRIQLFPSSSASSDAGRSRRSRQGQNQNTKGPERTDGSVRPCEDKTGRVPHESSSSRKKAKVDAAGHAHQSEQGTPSEMPTNATATATVQAHINQMKAFKSKVDFSSVDLAKTQDEDGHRDRQKDLQGGQPHQEQSSASDNPKPNSDTRAGGSAGGAVKHSNATSSPLIVRRMDTLLISMTSSRRRRTKNGTGEGSVAVTAAPVMTTTIIVLQFQSSSDCASFCDQLLELNFSRASKMIAEHTDWTNHVSPPRSSSLSHPYIGDQKHMDDKFHHVSHRVERRNDIGDLMTDARRIACRVRRKRHRNTVFLLEKGENTNHVHPEVTGDMYDQNLQNSERSKQLSYMRSLVVRLLHDNDFMDFVNELDECLSSSPDTAVVMDALLQSPPSRT